MSHMQKQSPPVQEGESVSMELSRMAGVHVYVRNRNRLPCKYEDESSLPVLLQNAGNSHGQKESPNDHRCRLAGETVSRQSTDCKFFELGYC